MPRAVERPHVLTFPVSVDDEALQFRKRVETQEGVRRTERIVFERCRLIARDYRAAMDELARAGEAFDVVFLDPPYRMENTGEICAALYDRGLLAEAFLLVVEHRRGCAPLLDARFEAFDQRSYGDTQITFARRAAAQEDNREDGTVPGEL